MGKFIAAPLVKQTLSTKGLVNHIYKHHGSYGKGIYAGVLQELVECLIETVATGVAVKLDGLGTFRPTFNCKPAASAEDFSLAENLKGVHLRLIPENVKDEQITSKQLMSKITFQKFEAPEAMILGDAEVSEGGGE